MTREISRHKGILKYLKKEVEIPTEYEAENNEEKIKIYKGNYRSWNLLIIRLTYIPFDLVRKCDDNAHDVCRALIENYGVSDDKKEILNELKNRRNSFKITDTSLGLDFWFNELYNLKLNFKKIKANYEKDEDELKENVFYILPEEYKQGRVSCNINMYKMKFKYMKKEIRWFWKTYPSGRNTKEKRITGI